MPATTPTNSHSESGLRAVHWLIGGAALVVFIAGLHLLGRIPWCTCGLGLWTSAAMSSETSQHLADPYSFTHLEHGILFYAALALVARRRSLATRGLVAILVEMAWELVENSPPVIERYRNATAALGYTGDSILNSVGDVVFCAAGVWLAARLPIWLSLLILVAVELILLATIRDNLTLNVVMLLLPLEGIKQWQLGG